MVRRELEGMSFLAVILRPHDWDKSADLMYADDGNIERDVPYNEISLVTDREVIASALTEENLERLQKCLGTLKKRGGGADPCGPKWGRHGPRALGKATRLLRP